MDLITLIKTIIANEIFIFQDVDVSHIYSKCIMLNSSFQVAQKKLLMRHLVLFNLASYFMRLRPNAMLCNTPTLNQIAHTRGT